MTQFAESTVEEATIGWFEELGYSYVYGPTLAPGELLAERKDYRDVLLPKLISGEIRVCKPAQ